MPNVRFKLPSRNWMIFLTITTSFTCALIYDRREKRRAQQKWCDLVAHLRREPLAIEQTRRKLTVFLAAPPGDGVRVAREYFQEYVKPVLVAAAMDYSIIEGRREGDVRASLAERIRKHRRKAGELSAEVDEQTIEDVVAETRLRIGVYDEPAPKGDLVIGRHTWKEYIRGLHEGWLGPLDTPAPIAADPLPDNGSPAEREPASVATTTATAADGLTESKAPTDKKDEKQQKKPDALAAAYIEPADYPSQALPPSFPSSFEGSIPIPFPHILGFLNTPIRVYRFLTQRHLADAVGREVAAIVLASATRPYDDDVAFSADPQSPSQPTSSLSADLQHSSSPSSTHCYEQQRVLEQEEHDWPKSVRKRDNSSSGHEEREREWLDAVVLDPRLASRMQRYILAPHEESRAGRIADGKEYILGEERPEHIPYWKHLWIKYGYGEDPVAAKRKPIIGNLDTEDGS